MDKEIVSFIMVLIFGLFTGLALGYMGANDQMLDKAYANGVNDTINNYTSTVYTIERIEYVDNSSSVVLVKSKAGIYKVIHLPREEAELYQISYSIDLPQTN